MLFPLRMTIQKVIGIQISDHGSRIRPTPTRPVVSERVKRLYYEKRGIPIRGYGKGALEMRPYLKDGS